MSVFLSRLWIVVFAAFPLAGFVIVNPNWASATGLDVWNLPAAQDEMRAAEAEAAQIQAHQESLFQQVEFGDHLAARVVDGSLTLREAVEELEPGLRARSDFECIWKCQYQERSFRHGVARYVITRVECVLVNEPTRWATVSGRLEAEYAAIK